MNLTYIITAAALSLTSVSAAAELPVPPVSAATARADAYVFHAGAGDVFEITTAMMAVKNASNPQLRNFATMLIAHHTNLTNSTLATAKAAGVMPPPPELTPMQKGMISQLIAAGPGFDRIFLQQQLAAHQQALALQTGYAASGDVPALRAGASAAVPVIRGHIEQVQQLLSATR